MKIPCSVRLLMPVLVMLAAAPAFAHQLIRVNDQRLDADTAIEIDDVAISQVAYHVASGNAPALWMTFEGVAGQQVYFETGVPYIERLAGLRPTTMLVGPGLPQVEAPFPLPEGMGAILYTTGDVMEPEVFAEEFTGTSSWKFGPWEPVLPETGRYYLVTFLPDSGPGKFWTAAGKAEVFGLEDILSLPQTILSVRQYHEISPWGGILGWGLLAIIAALAGVLSLFFS